MTQWTFADADRHELIGKYEFAIAKSEKPPDQAQQVEAQVNWLWSQWQKQHEEKVDEPARAAG